MGSEPLRKVNHQQIQSLPVPLRYSLNSHKMGIPIPVPFSHGTPPSQSSLVLNSTPMRLIILAILPTWTSYCPACLQISVLSGTILLLNTIMRNLSMLSSTAFRMSIFPAPQLNSFCGKLAHSQVNLYNSFCPSSNVHHKLWHALLDCYLQLSLCFD